MLEAYGDLVQNAAAAGAKQVTIARVVETRWRTLQVLDDGVGLTAEQLRYMCDCGNYVDTPPFPMAGRVTRHYRSPCVSLARHALVVTTIHQGDGARVPNMFGMLFMSRDLAGRPSGDVAQHTWVANGEAGLGLRRNVPWHANAHFVTPLSCLLTSSTLRTVDTALVSPAVAELLQHCQERADVGLRHITSWLQQHQQQQGVLVLLANMQMCGDARGGHVARYLK